MEGLDSKATDRCWFIWQSNYFDVWLGRLSNTPTKRDSWHTMIISKSLIASMAQSISKTLTKHHQINFLGLWGYNILQQESEIVILWHTAKTCLKTFFFCYDIKTLVHVSLKCLRCQITLALKTHTTCNLKDFMSCYCLFKLERQQTIPVHLELAV